LNDKTTARVAKTGRATDKLRDPGTGLTTPSYEQGLFLNPFSEFEGVHGPLVQAAVDHLPYNIICGVITIDRRSEVAGRPD